MHLDGRFGEREVSRNVFHFFRTGYLGGEHLQKAEQSPQVDIVSQHVPPSAYFGGMIGVLVVTLSSVVVDKVPQFTLSLLMFVGQVFTALILDRMLSGVFSLPNLVGGIFALAGLCVSGSH